jgi:hypothetical protein
VLCLKQYIRIHILKVKFTFDANVILIVQNTPDAANIVIIYRKFTLYCTSVRRIKLNIRINLSRFIILHKPLNHALFCFSKKKKKLKKGSKLKFKELQKKIH